MPAPKIHVSSSDADQLAALIDEFQGTRHSAAVDALDSELARATVVAPEQLPPDIVTMNSRVVFVDEETGVRREIVLVYPWDADIESSRVSILSPVGTALLGLTIGDTITWPLPRGKHRTLRVLAVEPPVAAHAAAVSK